MSNQADINYRDNQFYVSGELNFATVMPLLEKSLSLFAEQPAITLDFSAVKSSNSAGLALIMEWQKYANKHNKPFKIHNISADLLTLATAAGIDKLLAKEAIL